MTKQQLVDAARAFATWFAPKARAIAWQAALMVAAAAATAVGEFIAGSGRFSPETVVLARLVIGWFVGNVQRSRAAQPAS